MKRLHCREATEPVLIPRLFWQLPAERSFEQGFVDGAKMKILLGEGDFNACFFEACRNLLAEMAGHRQPFLHIGNPGMQFKLQSIIPKPKEKRSRGGSRRILRSASAASLRSRKTS